MGVLYVSNWGSQECQRQAGFHIIARDSHRCSRIGGHSRGTSLKCPAFAAGIGRPLRSSYGKDGAVTQLDVLLLGHLFMEKSLDQNYYIWHWMLKRFKVAHAVTKVRRMAHWPVLRPVPRQTPCAPFSSRRLTNTCVSPKTSESRLVSQSEFHRKAISKLSCNREE